MNKTDKLPLFDRSKIDLTKKNIYNRTCREVRTLDVNKPRFE